MRINLFEIILLMAIIAWCGPCTKEETEVSKNGFKNVITVLWEGTGNE